MLDKIVKFQIQYSKVLFLLLFFIIISGIYIGSNLQIDPDFGRLVAKDSQFNTNDRIISNAFEQNDVILISISLDENNILENRVTSLNDTRVDLYINELKLTLSESSYLKEISGPIISDDSRLAQLFLTLQTPNYIGSFKDVLSEFNYLVQEVGEPVGVNTQITGTPVLIDKISTLLIQDNLKTIGITIIFIFLILYWYSRDITFSLVTLSTPVISLIFLSSMMVLLNIPVTMTLAAVGVLVLGLGADYGIHIAIHYNKARLEHDSHYDALYHTISDLKLPITASFLTTFAGFIAMIFGVSPSSQAQGIVLSIGIAIIYSMTFISFPILMTLFFHKIETKPNSFFQRVVDILSKLAAYQTNYAKIILWGVGFMTIVMIIGASQVEFSTSNSNWIPDDDPTSTSFREINYRFGNQESLSIILISEIGDLRDIQIARDVQNLESDLMRIPQIESINSPFTNLDLDTNNYYSQLTNNYSNYFNRDFTLTRIVISTQNLVQGDDGKSVVYKEIKDIVDKHSIKDTQISYYGDIVRFDELGDSLQSDATKTTLIGFLLVFLVASILYASIYVGILSLFPILIAVIWTVGLMGFFGVPFTSLSTGIVSLVLGIGVDFSIHLVDGIRKYIRRTKNIKLSIEQTLSTSGKAIFLASLTTFVGFLALTFANLLGTQRLGFSLAFGILSIFLVTLLVVPSTLSIIYKRKLKKQGSL